MGVTLRNKEDSIGIDLGYYGFYKLRQKVADLAGDDIGEHYRNLNQVPIYDTANRMRFLKEYNAKTYELDKKYEGKRTHILNFLYASDCEGTLSVEGCKSLYEVIKNYDDDVLSKFQAENSHLSRWGMNALLAEHSFVNEEYDIIYT